MKRILSVSLFSLFLVFASGCGEEEALCAETEASCDGVCADTLHDPLHCGGCGIACAAGEFCMEGVCGCPEGESCDEAVVPDLFGICFQGGQMVPMSKANGLRTGTPFSGMEGPQAMARLGEDHVVVVGTFDQVLRVIDRRSMEEVGKLTFAPEAGATMPNHVVVEGSRAYVTLSGTNEVAIVDLAEPGEPRVIASVSTGENTNPFASAFHEGTLYVSLLESDELLPIEIGPEGGEAKDAFAILSEELEGKPNPAGVAVAAGRLFVALNNIGEDWGPAGNGRLWTYAIETGDEEIIDLGEECTNASFLVARGEDVIVSCTGRFGEDDGAIAIYAPASAMGTEAHPIGGAPARLSLDGDSLYVADNDGAEILRLDLGTHELEDIPVCSEQAMEFVADVLVFP